MKKPEDILPSGFCGLYNCLLYSLIIMKSFANATNAEAAVTVAEALRVNVTAVEVEEETAVGVGRMERTRPIVTARASEVNYRTISATTSRKEDMSITVSN